MTFQTRERPLFIVPAFNEAKNLPRVLAELIPVAGAENILVVNDGSADETPSVCRTHPVSVIDFPINLGVAGVLRAGFEFALRRGYRKAVQYDGDGQHIAEEAMRVVALLDSRGCDVAIGMRSGSSDKSSSLARKAGNRFLAFFLFLILGKRYGDPTSGFRAYSKKAMERFCEEFPEEYPEVEVLVLAKKLGLEIGEVAVNMRPRTEGKSSITIVGSAYYMAKVLLASFIALLRKY